MKTQLAIVLLAAALVAGCDKNEAPAGQTNTTQGAAPAPKPAAAPEDDPQKAANLAGSHPSDEVKNVVHVASSSKDHTTLVAALKAADYVDSLANPGPFTVFAPTNAAFDKLPKGTVEGLLKPEKKDDLRNILKYHVAVSTYQVKDLKDGETLGVANGGKISFKMKDGKITVNGANIIASVPASNGIIHVIDTVLLPPAN
jgi:uncharacterized surface protein with fasciclin (FAS1) repeats